MKIITMKKLYIYRLVILFATSALFHNNVFSQVSIANTNLYPYNVTPKSMMQITIINQGNDAKVRIDAGVYNSSNQELLHVISGPVVLKSGVNIISPASVIIASANYSTSNQGNYLKTKHQLPSGVFTYCVVLTPLEGLEEGDEYCQDIDAVDNEFLYLVYPADKDTVDTPNPVLSWAHSEPFSILSEGEFFRIVVVELNQKDQSAEAGVIANPPIFIKDFLQKHQVPYPFDAKKLEPGKRYGWQVQKISKGTVINKTEAWEFTLYKKEEIKEHMFTTLKRKLDGGFYHVYNEKIYFKFDEKYVSSVVKCQILNEKREVLKPELDNVKNSSENGMTKSTGYNQYVFDLSGYKLETGFYILEVYNGKNEKFQLKFYVE